MKIKALNEPDASSSDSIESSEADARHQNLTKEASEEQCFDKYRRALIAIQDLNENEAKDLLQELDSELQDLDSNSDTMNQLRYSVLKNLGNLQTDSIDFYIEALGLDNTDISVWIKTGERCMKLTNFHLARLCFEQALTINTKNWVAIDKLIELYYILHLPIELYDICLRALTLKRRHKKALAFLAEARRLQPSLSKPQNFNQSLIETNDLEVVNGLADIKDKRRFQIGQELNNYKRLRLSISLDVARTQSLASFGGYIVKIYERYSKQNITRNTPIDVALNSSLPFSQQLSHASINSQSNNQSNSDPTNSQDVEMIPIDANEGNSISDTERLENRNDQTVSNDDNDQTKSNSKSRSNQTINKNSSLSFAAMLFPMDMGDKRRSSRNRSNQDDTFSFKMKFDELNDLLPECLRIGAIEQALQKKHEAQQRDFDEKEKEQKEEVVVVDTNIKPIREDLIIKNIIESISTNLNPNGSNIKKDIKLCDIFYLYLSELSSKKQNTLPEVYEKIYKIYRRLCPLPNDAFVEIGPDGLTTDELWFTLTANEISYQKQDCLFLLRLLEQLNMCLDEVQHKEYLVRLFLILGTNLDPGYLEIALENIGEDTKVFASNRKVITRAHIKTLIDRSNKLQSQDNETTDNSLELINRLAPKSENEMSDREINSLCAAIKSAEVWQRGLDILNQRNDLNSDIIIETINVCLKNGAKMDAILASKLCKDAISGSRPATWTCLYRGWSGLLTKEQLIDEHMIERIDKFFELGHQTLGKKCTCTLDKGEFLMLYVEHLLLDERDNFEERELLGALNCLFAYPSKRPASVAGHKAQRVNMIWEYAQVVYPYLEPEEQPTYMSLLRKVGINNELEQLFREIASSAPDSLHPKKNVHLIENYINKGDAFTKEDIRVEKNEVTKDIYYFLADYYFKNKDFDTAKDFYNYDLVLNPDRFDSWAASGLIRANGIDKVLSNGTITMEEFVDSSFQALADSAIRCFKQGTNLRPDEPKATLWIEFGNLTYNLSSLASRLYFYNEIEREIDGKDEVDTVKLESRHKDLYDLAHHCFKSANKLCQSEEIWLHYYMLGKIYERLDPFKALEYFSKADSQLYHEGASYPSKISYHNPPELAYESMEIHYRIHSCAMKYLLETPELNQENLNLLKRYLLNAGRSPFVEMIGIPSPSSNDFASRFISRDVDLLLTDIIDSIERDADFDELIFMCLHGMKRCLVRCDKNFKALYRLSYYYKKIRDSKMSQDILLVRELKTDRRIPSLLARKPWLPEFRAAPPDLQGLDSLFKDRKLGNLFFNIWRIPVEEVDRPGSFEHWMFKCTRLLILTCLDLNDTNLLTIIAFQLSRQPETSKKYLQDKPRLLLAKFAVESIIKIVKEAIRKADDIEAKRVFIKEGVALADKFIKSNIFAEKMRILFNELQMSLPPQSQL